MLRKYFKKVDCIFVENTWHYTDAEEILQRMLQMYDGQQKYISENSTKILKYFNDWIKENGEVTYTYGSLFRRCSK